jgi:hypothetical protein
MLAGSWAVRETFTAVVTTNIPMLFPTFKKAVAPIVSRVGSSLGFSRNSKSGGRTESKLSKITIDTWKRKSSRRGSMPLPGNHMSGDRGSDNDSETFIVDLPELSKDGRSHGSQPDNTGIQRQVEVSVFEMTKDSQGDDGAYTQNGNYTTTWSGSTRQGSRQASQSEFYLSHIHQDGYQQKQ